MLLIEELIQEDYVFLFFLDNEIQFIPTQGGWNHILHSNVKND